MKKIDTESVFARYRTRTLTFKLLASALLGNNKTRTVSIYALKKVLYISQGAILKLINGIYFGGETLNQVTSTTSALRKENINSIIDYAIEGENTESVYNDVMNKTFSLIDIAAENRNIPFVVIKPSSLGSIELYRAITLNQNLTPEQQQEWDSVTERYTRIVDAAGEKKVRIMVDAEQSWIQPAVDNFIVELMKKYNRSYPLLTLTLQFYCKNKLERLKEHYRQACEHDFYLGIKLVRGAYLEEEKRISHDYCFTEKAETDNNYNNAIHFVAEHTDRIFPFFATHNEHSLALIRQSPTLRKNIWLGQLYGMGDHITWSLTHDGFSVCKYVPFGPLKKSLPYLLRRIEENAIPSTTFITERKLIRKELHRRMKRILS
ncbi:proline dehydrogenase family protein [Dickeya dianthicola]|uniref:proline dehydrogenase family protein n=1 Tax=Dickeya dianthicola TaxID=204039 RepID=UPI001869279F|nr:proline dehydrogenase family protein [Dickeya dianthicola]QOL16274.1 antibiotic biosynthesis protein CarD [Dickeya dianthicola]